MTSVDERFWSYVDKTNDCWLWTGAMDYGYGRFYLEKKHMRTHRLSLEWSLGRPIGSGLVVRHKCRNRNCVNPEHLEEGTQKENGQDKVRDGTSPRGTKNHKCKLTDQQVLAIRADSRTHKIIAAEYGISRTTVSYIKTGKNWGWLLNGFLSTEDEEDPRNCRQNWQPDQH